jgi:GxxExxY protein
MEWKYGDITSKIIGAAMEVHGELGPGFPEYVYCRALQIEFSARSIEAVAEYPMPVFYKGATITTRRVDFLVEDIIPTEIKAITQLDDDHLAQAINYLEAWNREIGLLINFGASSLQFKRLLNRRFKPYPKTYGN